MRSRSGCRSPAPVLAATYPFLKRYTHLPQVGLGIAFSLGHTDGLRRRTRRRCRLPLWLLFCAAVVWSVVYDTFYAMVDRDDDLRDRREIHRDPVRRGRPRDHRALQALRCCCCCCSPVASSAWGRRTRGPARVGAALFAWQQWLIRHRERERLLPRLPEQQPVRPARCSPASPPTTRCDERTHLPRSASPRVPAADVECARRARYPVPAPRVPGALEDSGSVGGESRLGAAPPAAARGRTPGGGDALLSEEALLRRVRVRLGVGRCLSPPRRAVLPEAAERRAVHARDRAAAAAGARAPRSRRCCDPCSRRCARKPARVGLPPRGTCCFPSRCSPRPAPQRRSLRRTGVQFHWLNRGYRDFDDFLARSPRASASS